MDNYKDWLAYKSQIEGRDVSQDEQDYDLEGYFNTLKANPIDGGHLDDSGKKPNHPTFSTHSKMNVPVIQQGGEWSEDQAIHNGWSFKPSQQNIENMGGRENLQKYFNEYESPEALNLPPNERFSRIRQKLK